MDTQRPRRSQCDIIMNKRYTNPQWKIGGRRIIGIAYLQTTKFIQKIALLSDLIFLIQIIFNIPWFSFAGKKFRGFSSQVKSSVVLLRR